LLQRRDIHAELPQNRIRNAFFILQERREKMLCVDLAGVVVSGDALRPDDCLLRLLSELVEVVHLASELQRSPYWPLSHPSRSTRG
jgi:hypothetical protein